LSLTPTHIVRLGDIGAGPGHKLPSHLEGVIDHDALMVIRSRIQSPAQHVVCLKTPTDRQDKRGSRADMLAHVVRTKPPSTYP
jgi:hypothetical protein